MRVLRALKENSPSMPTVLSALFFYLSSEQFRFGWFFTLFALVPWIVDLNRKRSWREVVVQSIWMQIAMGLVAFEWMLAGGSSLWRQSSVFVYGVYLIGAPLTMLYVGAYALFRHWLRVRLFHPLMIAVAGAAAYALGADIISFLNVTLANQLFREPFLLSFARLGGAHFVTFLIVLSSELAAYLWMIRPQKLAVARAMIAILPIFVFVIASALYSFTFKTASTPTISIAIAQTMTPAAPVQSSTEATVQYFAESEKKKIGLLERAKAERPSTQLFILPESALSPLYFADRRPSLALYHEAIDEKIRLLNAPIFFGALRQVGEITSNEFSVTWPSSDSPQKTIAFRKRRLMPFGETLPSWLKGFAAIDGLFHLNRMAVPGSVPIRGELKGNKWGGLICNEVFYQDLAQEHASQGAKYFVVLGSESLLKGSWGNDHLMAAAVLRAIENAVPVYKSSDFGGSAVIDAKGKILQRAPIGEEAIIALDAPLGSGSGTLFSHYPRAFFFAALMVVVGVGIASGLRKVESEFQ